MIHSIDGDFGKVRTFSHLPTQTAKSIFNYTTSAGWHLCNDKYHIRREEGLDAYIVFFTVSGCGQMRIEDSIYRLPEKTTAIIPINAAHEYYVAKDEAWEFYWIYVNGDSAEKILAYLVDHYGCIFPTGSRLGDIYRELEDLIFFKSTANASFETYASSIISDIVHQLIIGTQEMGSSSISEKSAVKRLLKHLEINFSSRISIKDISESWFISSAHLSRQFKDMTGFTPYEYLLHYRIMKSKELLLYTDMNLKEVALRTGFHYASNYISQFKARESITPEQFRNLSRTGSAHADSHVRREPKDNLDYPKLYPSSSMQR